MAFLRSRLRRSATDRARRGARGAGSTSGTGSPIGSRAGGAHRHRPTGSATTPRPGIPSSTTSPATTPSSLPACSATAAPTSPAGTTRSARVEEHADRGMRDLLSVLGIDRVTLVGHSLGGGVAGRTAGPPDPPSGPPPPAPAEIRSAEGATWPGPGTRGRRAGGRARRSARWVSDLHPHRDQHRRPVPLVGGGHRRRGPGLGPRAQRREPGRAGRGRTVHRAARRAARGAGLRRPDPLHPPSGGPALQLLAGRRAPARAVAPHHPGLLPHR